MRIVIPTFNKQTYSDKNIVGKDALRGGVAQRCGISLAEPLGQERLSGRKKLRTKFGLNQVKRVIIRTLQAKATKDVFECQTDNTADTVENCKKPM